MLSHDAGKFLKKIILKKSDKSEQRIFQNSEIEAIFTNKKIKGNRTEFIFENQIPEDAPKLQNHKLNQPIFTD